MQANAEAILTLYGRVGYTTFVLAVAANCFGILCGKPRICGRSRRHLLPIRLYFAAVIALAS